MTRWTGRPRKWRDATLLVGGLSIVLHQEFLTHSERPYLLGSGLVMMGLSAALGDVLRVVSQIRNGIPRGSRPDDPPDDES